MPFVIPKYSLAAVVDWQALLVENTGDSKELNEASAAIINYMPVIGITELTKENVTDAWLRIAAFQAQVGTFVTDRQTGRPLYLTRDDVERHIGLQTEGNNKPIQLFWTYLCRQRADSHRDELPFLVANGGGTLLELCGVVNPAAGPSAGATVRPNPAFNADVFWAALRTGPRAAG